MGRGEDIGHKLAYDPVTKTVRPVPRFRPVPSSHDPDGSTEITPEDATLYATKAGGQKRIVISGELLQAAKEEANNVFFHCWDDGDVYSLLTDEYSTGSVPGTLHCANGREGNLASCVGKSDDRVRLIIRRPSAESGNPVSLVSIKVTGFVLHGVEWEEVLVESVPVRNEIVSRIGGLIETDVLAKKRVLVVGLGSGGSHITMELAKSGVMQFYLIDFDRLEVANVARHVLSLPHVGRFKTKAMAQSIREKNPYAEIQTWEEKVSWENIDEVRLIVRENDVIICATGDKPSKLILNRLSVEEDKPCIFAAAYRRAYGGMILFRRSLKDPCYQCFSMSLPKEAADEEISGRDQAERVAYSDRPVPIEPGLSTDIAPISIMVVKLVIQELLKGTETTLRSLDEDLVAPWYLWLNRREPGTQYERLKPLEFNIDGLHVLRWYGVDMKPNPACPVCRDFEGEMGKQEGPLLPDLRKLIGELQERVI